MNRFVQSVNSLLVWHRRSGLSQSVVRAVQRGRWDVSCWVLALSTASWALLVSPLLGWQDELPQRDRIQQAIVGLRSLEGGGVGHSAAIEGAKELGNLEVSRLRELLAAMDDTHPVAMNWIRGLIYSWLDRQLIGDHPRIVEELKLVFSDRQLGDASREFAYELLGKLAPELASDVLPELIHDTSAKLVALGVDWQLQQASKTQDAVERLGILTLALSKGIDVKQVQAIGQQLKSLGVSVDLNRQLGFLTTWHLVAGFDNLQEEGLHHAYPVEAELNQINLQGQYPLPEDRFATWSWHHSASSEGVVDLNQLLGKAPNQVAYAAGSFYSKEGGAVELKIASPNAIKVWVNGQLLLTNEIYHNGNAIDKFVIPVGLQAGNNSLLIKVCQNDRPEPWAQAWEFRLRVCDLNGRGLAPDEPPARRGGG